MLYISLLKYILCLHRAACDVRKFRERSWQRMDIQLFVQFVIPTFVEAKKENLFIAKIPKRRYTERSQLSSTRQVRRDRSKNIPAIISLQCPRWTKSLARPHWQYLGSNGSVSTPRSLLSAPPLPMVEWPPPPSLIVAMCPINGTNASHLWHHCTPS
jgi:hypothetical protein